MPGGAFPLPNRIVWGSAVRMDWSVTQIRKRNGHIIRIAEWPAPLRRFALDVAAMNTVAEWQALQTHWADNAGPVFSFPLTEPITATVYTVKYAENSLEIAWEAYDWMTSALVLEEVPNP